MTITACVAEKISKKCSDIREYLRLAQLAITTKY